MPLTSHNCNMLGLWKPPSNGAPAWITQLMKPSKGPGSLRLRTWETICILLCTCLQVGPDDLRRNALLQLLVQAAKRDAFHTLRTVEQLGYMVRPRLLP